MSYPRRTRTKSYTQPQQSPTSEFTFTAASAIVYPRSASTSSSPIVPSSSATLHTLRKRTSSSGYSSTKTRKRASSATAASFPNRPFLFTPSKPPIVGPRNSSTTTALGPPPPYTPFPLAAKSRSSSHLSQNISTATFLAQYTPPPPPPPPPRMRLTRGAGSDSESEPDPLDEDEDGVIYTAKPQPGAAFRSRIFPRHSKGITTAPGQLGAGETETEADEPVRSPNVPPRS